MYLGMLTAELGDSREAFCNVINTAVEIPQTEEMEISKVTLLNGKGKLQENTQYIYLTELKVNLY